MNYKPDIIPPDSFKIFNIQFNTAMVSALIVTIVTIILVIIIRIFLIPKWRRNVEKISGIQVFCESIVSSFEKTGHDTLEKNSNNVVPTYFVFAFFICIGTLTEMLGLRPPTSDLSFTLMAGLVTFLLINYYGFKEKKLKRLKRYFPNLIFIISDLSVPISLALRLFCSVVSGTIIMDLIYNVLPPYFLVVFPLIGSFMFTVFHALIQSYVFMLLSETFIQEAIE